MHVGILSVLYLHVWDGRVENIRVGELGVVTGNCLLLRLAEQSSGRGNPDVCLVLYPQSVASIAGRLMSFALMLTRFLRNETVSRGIARRALRSQPRTLTTLSGLSG